MYRVSIELEKHEWKFGRTRSAVRTRAAGEVFPQLFRVLLNFHEFHEKNKPTFMLTCSYRLLHLPGTWQNITTRTLTHFSDVISIHVSWNQLSIRTLFYDLLGFGQRQSNCCIIKLRQKTIITIENDIVAGDVLLWYCRNVYDFFGSIGNGHNLFS